MFAYAFACSEGVPVKLWLGVGYWVKDVKILG